MREIIFFYIFLVAIAFLITDTIINQVSDFVVEWSTSTAGIVLFLVIFVIFAISSYAFLRYIHSNTLEIRNRSVQIRSLQFAVYLTQFVLLGLFVYLIIQILIFSQYSTTILTATSAVSQPMAAGVLIISSAVVLGWYRSNKQVYVVLLFGLGFAITAYDLVQLTFTDVNNLLSKPRVITPDSEVIFPDDLYVPGSIQQMFSDLYDYTATISFVVLLAGSAVLLHHYSKKIGIAKYWTLILLPLVYYLSTLVDMLGLYTPESDSELFNYYLYSSLNSIGGGILLGLAFWTASRTLMQNKIVSNYLRFCAYGFVLHFIALQTALVAAAYPPFGFATISMLPLSSYMVFIGLYCSAVSVSQDVRLRRYMKDLANDSRFLSSISDAQMEKQIQSKASDLENVVRQQRRELEAKSGIESSIQEQDIKQYLLEALQEVDKHKSAK